MTLGEGKIKVYMLLDEHSAGGEVEWRFAAAGGGKRRTGISEAAALAGRRKEGPGMAQGETL